MDNEKIIARIKKCLALSRSANEHEAAVARKQALALMRKYGLDHQTVSAGDVREVRVNSACKRRPSKWEQSLATLVATQFECMVLSGEAVDQDSVSGAFRKQWWFIGEQSKVEIAAYAFEVLMRKIRNALELFLEKQAAILGHKRRAAKLYCTGWVMALEDALKHFAGDHAVPSGVLAFAESKYEIQVKRGRKGKMQVLRQDEWQALQAGMNDGKAAKLHRGVADMNGAPLALATAV